MIDKIGVVTEGTMQRIIAATKQIERTLRGTRNEDTDAPKLVDSGPPGALVVITNEVTSTPGGYYSARPIMFFGSPYDLNSSPQLEQPNDAPMMVFELNGGILYVGKRYICSVQQVYNGFIIGTAVEANQPTGTSSGSSGTSSKSSSSGSSSGSTSSGGSSSGVDSFIDFPSFIECSPNGGFRIYYSRKDLVTGVETTTYAMDIGCCGCGSTSTSSGTSSAKTSSATSGTPTATIGCCSAPVPQTLTLTIGGLGTYTLTYQGTGSNAWISNTTQPAGIKFPGVCGTYNFGMYCNPLTNQIYLTANPTTTCLWSFNITTLACSTVGSPFFLQASATLTDPGTGSCPCVGTTYTFTITP